MIIDGATNWGANGPRPAAEGFDIEARSKSIYEWIRQVRGGVLAGAFTVERQISAAIIHFMLGDRIGIPEVQDAFDEGLLGPLTFERRINVVMLIAPHVLSPDEVASLKTDLSELRALRNSFELDLPTAKAHGVDFVGAGIVTGYLGPCGKILVVDDTPANRTLLSDALTQSGFEVCQAENGENALARTAAGSLDLILMDVMTPIMDGVEATRRLRVNPERARIPVIAISASVGDEDRMHALAAGADAFLGKPVDLRQLFA